MSAPQFYVYIVLSRGCCCELGEEDFEGVFASREAAQAYIDGTHINSSCYSIQRDVIDQPLRVPGLKDG